MRRLSAWCGPPLAALAGAAFLAVVLPTSGAADTARELRARAAALASAQQELQRTEHGVLLALYAAETEVARALADQARLAGRSVALAREEASLRRRTDAVRRSLAASRERVGALLRLLYIEGEADPIAAVLGAQSLDEALVAIDSLEQAAAHNRRLASEARAKALLLDALRAELQGRRSRLDSARSAAAASTARLQQAADGRRRTLASVRDSSTGAAARIDELLAQARAAERASSRLTRAAVTAETASAAEATPAAAPEAVTGLPAAAGTRTLVVDAVAYHLPGRTASGLPVGIGVVAVDPTVIPLGTRMFVPGYGPGIAADVGSAVKGNIIDLWMPSTAAARRWGRRTVTITIYG